MNVGHFFRHPLLLKIQSKKIPRNQCRSKIQFSYQKFTVKKSAKSMSVKKSFRICNFHIKIRNFSTMKIQGMSIPGSSRRSIPDAIPKIATKSAD